MSEFNIEKKGYNRVEVDAKIAELTSENLIYKEKIASLEEQLSLLSLQVDEVKRKEALIEQTILNAERTAEDIISEASKKADDIIRQRDSDADERLSQLNEEKQELKDVCKRVENILRSQLALVEKYNTEEQ